MCEVQAEAELLFMVRTGLCCRDEALADGGAAAPESGSEVSRTPWQEANVGEEQSRAGQPGPMKVD